MKRIVIAHNYTESSFAAMSFHLAHHLASLGNSVVFISHKPYFSEREVVKIQNGEIIIYSWPTEKRPTSVNDFIWFAKIYLKYKPEVVIGHFVGGNITISLSKMLSFGKAKTLAYYHTLTNQIAIDSRNSSIKRKLLFCRKKLFYKLFCDVIVCPSKLAKIDLESSFSVANGVVVLNPMTDRFKDKKNNSEGNIVVSYLGRLDASKGVLDLINAFEIFKLKKVKTKIILNIAGTGNQQAEVESLVNRNNSINYFGGLPYSKIDDYLVNSHFTIIPSKFDNLPTAGLESLMNKTPLLISNLTGLTNYLIDGNECFKFDSNIDSIVSIFEKIEENIDKYQEMSENARSTFLKLFSMDNYYTEFSKIILSDM